MRMPTLLFRARPFRSLFRTASGADPGSLPAVLVLLVLWASMGVPGLTELPMAAERVGPSPALAQAAEDEDEDEPEDTGLPLEVDRLVPLDMTEGSWISLDVSPDGETIVFDYLGDLFAVPLAGGDATQLTSGMAFDAQPRFSPDGSRIVYVSDADGGQNVWVMARDGSDPVQLSKGASNRAESPEWLPDGRYVVAAMGAFRGRGLPKLKLFHVDGGSGILLISEPDNLKTIGPAVSADGRFIWYARRTGDWQYNAQLPQYQLEAYDVETGERYPRSSRYGSAMRPTLSPDGRWLVFGTRHDEHTGLVIRDLDTGAERWLAYPVQHDDQESRATLDVLPGMSFTPDSRHLVASWGGGLWKVPVAGGAAGEDPVPGAVRPDAGAEGGVRLSHRRYPHVHGAADPRRGAVTGRRAARVHGARPPVGGRRGWRQSPAADRGRPVRALPRVVAGRRVDRLLDLGRRAGSPLQDTCRRDGRGGAADPRRRRLVPAGVGAGGPDRVGAGVRSAPI